MAARPAKRRRRSNTTTLDEEGDDGEQLPLRASKKHNSQLELNYDAHSTLSLSPHRPNGTKYRTKGSASNASPKPSPEKVRTRIQPGKESEKSKTLHTFFNRATEEQRWHKKLPSNSPELEYNDGEFGDAIEDDESVDSAFLEVVDRTEVKKTFLSKDSQSLKRTDDGSAIDQRGAPTLSQRFVKPSVPAKRSSNGVVDIQQNNTDGSHRPWADRYGPSTLDELAVHKKKVADVRLWLSSVLSGSNRQRLLILKGPAGSGKSTTVSLLSQADGFDLVTWQNPTVSEAGTNTSIARQFEEFLSRGGQFGSLDFGDNFSKSEAANKESSRRVIIIEEFPHAMTRSSNTLESFRSVLLQSLARSNIAFSGGFRGQSNPADADPPIVMVISETLLSSSTAFTDSFTAHRLLGPEILNHPRVAVMDFNPIAPTFIGRALDLVIKKEARDSTRRRAPGPAVLQSLSEIGDVRSAINSLEFLCVRSDNSADWSGTVATKARKSGKDSIPPTEMEKNSLQLISQRETTLDMFHAAGKVVYNKREDPRIRDPKAEPPPKPPDHLLHLHRPKISQVDIEALLSETGTDIQTFISTTHENYVLSCNGDDFVEAFDSCADILSASDVLNPDSRQNRKLKAGSAAIVQANLQSGSSDALRQDEISFQVATRGLLFSLPYPVSRAAPSSGRKSDAYKIFYPGSLRLWKPTEEIDALVSLFLHDVYYKSISTATKSSTTEGVASWKSRSVSKALFSGTQASEPPSTGSQDESLSSASPPTRDDLTLDILPYLTTIRSAKKEEITTLKRITQFHGMRISVEEPFDEDPNDEGEQQLQVSGNVAIRDDPATKSTTNLTGRLGQGDKEAATQMEKLYISDDDIEDD